MKWTSTNHLNDKNQDRQKLEDKVLANKGYAMIHAFVPFLLEILLIVLGTVTLLDSDDGHWYWFHDSGIKSGECLSVSIDAEYR